MKDRFRNIALDATFQLMLECYNEKKIAEAKLAYCYKTKLSQGKAS